MKLTKELADEVANMMAGRLYGALADGLIGIEVGPGDILRAAHAVEFSFDKDFEKLNERIAHFKKELTEHELSIAWNEQQPDKLFDNPVKTRSGTA